MMTRPDLAFAFAELSKLNPGQVHLKAACSMLAYLIGTTDKGVTYSSPALDKHVNSLYCWVDSDHTADQDTSRSVTGYVVSLNNCPVSWCAKQQLCTMLSLVEAELVETLYVEDRVSMKKLQS
eukprot:2894085-Rhodomonas_salina.2